MEQLEDEQRRFEEAVLRGKEDTEGLFQVDMRDEWLQIGSETVGKVGAGDAAAVTVSVALAGHRSLVCAPLSEKWFCNVYRSVTGCSRAAVYCPACYRQERYNYLSLRRAIARGAFSSFFVVRDVNAGRQFVLKAMFIRAEQMEKRLLLSAEQLQVRRVVKVTRNHSCCRSLVHQSWLIGFSEYGCELFSPIVFP